MSAEARCAPAEAALTQRFLLDYPHEAARLFEAMPADDAAALLAAQPPHAALRAWQALAPDVALRRAGAAARGRWRGTCWPRPSRWPASPC